MGRLRAAVIAGGAVIAGAIWLRLRRRLRACGIDLTRYPIDDINSPAAQELIARAHQSLTQQGVASFPGFLTREAVITAADEARQRAATAFVTDDCHTAWQLPLSNSFAATHVRNLMMRTRVASIAYDEVGSSLRELYESETVLRFVEAVVGRQPGSMHRLADPLGACTVNVFRTGWSHAWHFDEAEYTTTLCLQQAEEGGEFVFSPPLRSSQEELVCGSVAALLRAHSEYDADAMEGDVACPPARTAPFEPGTLQIFGGRYCLHCVRDVRGTRDRLVAVLCFASAPGIVNSARVQKMFWGRTSPEVNGDN